MILCTAFCCTCATDTNLLNGFAAKPIGKGTVSLRLVRPNGSIQEFILNDVIYAPISYANLISGRRMRADIITFDMRDCTLRHNNDIIG